MNNLIQQDNQDQLVSRNNSKLNLSLVIVITMVVTALVIGGLVFWWQQSIIKDSENKVKTLQQQVDTLQIEESSISVDDDLGGQPPNEWKIFIDVLPEPFFLYFLYPDEFVYGTVEVPRFIDGTTIPTHSAFYSGFWTKKAYVNATKNISRCDTCWPDVLYYLDYAQLSENQTMEDFIIDKVDWPGSTLAESIDMISGSESAFGYEYLTLGNNDFVKVIDSGMHSFAYYFTSRDNIIFVFRTWANDSSLDDAEDILSSLAFISPDNNNDNYDKEVSSVMEFNDTWNRYVNPEYNFKIFYPKKNQNDNPLVIIEDDDVFYVSENTVSDDEIVKKDNYQGDVVGIQFTVKEVNGDDELESVVREEFGVNCSLGKRTEYFGNSGIFHIELNRNLPSDFNPSDPDICFVNQPVIIRYIPDENIVSLWRMGQSEIFFDNAGVADYRIVGSFLSL